MHPVEPVNGSYLYLLVFCDYSYLVLVYGILVHTT